MAPTIATDRCPRCGAGFHCGARDCPPCACTTLRLDAATLAALRAQFTDCLCLACLEQLAAAPSLALAQGASATANAR
jgi:Cysteine-rich CWC